MDEFLKQCFYAAGRNFVCMKSKLRDKPILVSFIVASRISDSVEAIYGEFDALFSRRIWKYVDERPKMYVLLYTWNFGIKDAPRQHTSLPHEAIFFFVETNNDHICRPPLL